MAFERNDLVKFDNAVASDGSKISQYVYKSSVDALAVIEAAGYFNDAGFQDETDEVTASQTQYRGRNLDEHCLIYIIDSANVRTLRAVVTNGSTGDVTVAALA